MKRPTVSVTVRDEGGALLHSEVRAALNSGVRASEDAVRQIARSMCRGVRRLRIVWPR